MVSVGMRPLSVLVIFPPWLGLSCTGSASHPLARDTPVEPSRAARFEAAESQAAPEREAGANTGKRVVPQDRRIPGGRAAFLRELAVRLADTPEWTLTESAHYAFTTCVRDDAFVVRLREHTEAARELATQFFPHPDGDPVTDDRALDVVRCAKDEEQYHSYGGPAGSGGYFSPLAHEVVVHRDASTNDASTWRELQGLVFYSYAHELHGDAQLPAWFATGHAEFLRGFEPARREAGHEREFPVAAPNAVVLATWRRLDAEHALPTLEELLAWTKIDWERGRERSTAAWALVWHLRALERGEPEHPHARILARWYAEWLRDGDAARATAAAFACVDRAQLERELHARIAALR